MLIFLTGLLVRWMGGNGSCRLSAKRQEGYRQKAQRASNWKSGLGGPDTLLASSKMAISKYQDFTAENLAVCLLCQELFTLSYTTALPALYAQCTAHVQTMTMSVTMTTTIKRPRIVMLRQFCTLAKSFTHSAQRHSVTTVTLNLQSIPQNAPNPQYSQNKQTDKCFYSTTKLLNDGTICTSRDVLVVSETNFVIVKRR